MKTELLEIAGFEVKKQAGGYAIIKTEKGTTFLILDKFHGFDLIPPAEQDCKYFRTLSEIVEHIKDK